MNTKLKKIGLLAAVGLLTAASAHTAYADLGELTSTPLFISNAVEPNIFMTLDDSGSMDWELMYPEGTEFYPSSGGTPSVDGRRRYYWNPNWQGSYMYGNSTADRNIVPPAGFDFNTTWDDDLWVLRTHHVNTLYYNPELTYLPWPGEDALGNPLFQDADPTRTLRDPINPTGNWVDLTASHDFFDTVAWVNRAGIYYIPIYYEWIDTDNDGVVESTDARNMIRIEPATTSYPSGRSYAEEMQNFANWFQYYRKREFTTKAAVGAVIATADRSRMGFEVINDGRKKNAVTMSDAANRLDMIGTFYKTPSLAAGTPLRRALVRVGDYFSLSSGGPILPAADGGECQQNFNILMSDGFWNGGSPSVGNADRSASADGGFDGDETESIDGGNYEDTRSDTLADVAMHYYERDLRTDLANRVPPTPGVDLAEHQHLVNFTIGLGLRGELDPQTDDPTASGFAWPNPLDQEDLHRIDDMWHAAYNSRGQFLSAQDPRELENALRTALTDITERTATAAAASVTSARLTTESVVYLAEFNTNRWRGTIYAYKIANLDTGELNALPEWSAAEVLDARDLDTDPRTILTYSRATDGLSFEWDNLTPEMQADLKTNSLGGLDSDAIAQARLDYIRGARDQEGTGLGFRERATRLGDIVNSGPVYVGEPNLRLPEEFPVNNPATRYSDFKESKANRAGVVYVGSNDGMIHAFDETNGKELLAYIPSNLFSTGSTEGLHYLTQPNYVHQFYNDLTPSLSDVNINTGLGSGWRTVLISGQRGGGRGYSALDVTDPSTFNTANAQGLVMWEFTSDDDPDLGYTFSRPQIGMTNDGQWVAIFGNGYNQTGSDHAQLFIVKIEAGVDGSWDAGDYIKISTGSPHKDGGANGLGTPALADLDGNGTIDRAYAGDLNGDLWAFDLSSGSSASWNLDYGAPLFTTDGQEAITSKPVLSLHPTEPSDGSNDPNVMVFFGSGQYLVDNDKTSNDNHYFYGVWDKGNSGLNSGNLIDQSYQPSFSDRVLTQNLVDYSIYYGWRIPLPDAGERSITNPAVRGDVVLFNTSVPSGGNCTTGGYGYRFAVDIATGGTPDEPVLDINNDGVVDEEDTLDPSKEVVQSADKLSDLPTDNTFTEKVGYTGKDPFAIQELTQPQIGRFSWQELLQ